MNNSFMDTNFGSPEWKALVDKLFGQIHMMHMQFILEKLDVI